MKYMLSDISNNELIKRIKNNSTVDSSIIAEIDKRLANDEFNDTDVIKLFDVLVSIKNGGD